MKRARFYLLLAISLVIVFGFGSTALAWPGPPCPSPTPPPPPSYTLCATGQGEIQTIYNWTIEKSVETHGDMNLSVGESQVVDYKIEVGKEEETGFGILVTGTLSMTVNAEDGLDVVSITGKLHKSGDGDFGVQTLASGTHYDPSGDPYTFDYSYFTTDHLGPGFYSLIFEVDASNHSDRDTSADVSFAFVDVNDEVTVTDVVASGLPGNVVAAPDGDYQETRTGIVGPETFEYTVTFTNNGNKSGNSWPYDNTATIVETEQSSSASVTVSVPKEKTKTKTKTVVVEVTPEPTAAPVAVELPKTGGFIEWEWIALAGGLLTSCGGGLYLIRRRRMKK
jgi:LPXTG-motif cell wall-anchored protein